jgi:DNA-binding transcriptional regulator LsrR (DeoR family)
MKDIDKVSSDTARAAWLYFIEEFTQSQIAEKLGVSRSTVIRLLHKARESGLVTISLGVRSDAGLGRSRQPRSQKWPARIR